MSNRRKIRKHRHQHMIGRYFLLEFYNTEHPPIAGTCAGCGKYHAEAEKSAELIGAAIVPGTDLSTAADAAWDAGCNPGGSVMGAELWPGVIEHCGAPVGHLFPASVVGQVRESLTEASRHMGYA